MGLLAATGCATSTVSVTSKAGTTFGKIYVDTPEVYTRERLVNDRFQQDAWLREKLSEVPTINVQGGVGSSSRTTTSLALATGVKPQAPPKEKTAQAELPKELGDTPIEQFRDVMAYREEVRNEILENQLDDRHDIAGNTLYRLKFDATVVPLHDTSAYAMVEVTIRGPSIWNISGDGEKGRAPLGVPRGSKMSEATLMLLDDAEYARYVKGLDDKALDSYRRVYENWVEDIDPARYSEEDILYGELQAYLDYDYRKKGPVPKRSDTAWFDTAAERDAVQKDLVALGVPASYHIAGGEVGGGSFLGVYTGLANFISNLREHETVVYTYAVTPKERVQRVYGNTLAAGAVGVSVGAQQEGLGASFAHSKAREAQANAIMRQPQVVGYSPGSSRATETTMGWLIGPRYRISSDPEGMVSFRHVPTQHTLTGIVSVPSWWNELNLVTRTYWLDENGNEFTESGQKLSADSNVGEGSVTKVSLPSHWTGIVDVLDPKSRKPKVDRSAEVNDELRACQPGSVIIRGSQLWRSTVVTLGGQQADAISVLPNMEGIIATFNMVEPSMSGSEPLYLWTSEGEELARTISITGECDINLRALNTDRGKEQKPTGDTSG